MHHGPPWGHYNHFAPAGVNFFNDFWNECYRTKGIAIQTLQQDIQCIYVQSICIRDWENIEWKFVIHFGGKHLYHRFLPNYANQMEHFKMKGPPHLNHFVLSGEAEGYDI